MYLLARGIVNIDALTVFFGSTGSCVNDKII